MKVFARNKFLSAGVAMVLSLTVLTGCIGESALNEVSESQAGAETIMETVPVKTMALAKSTIDEVVYTFGYIEGNDSYFVTPYGSGIIDQVLVDEGDYVSAGDVLYQLEVDDLAFSEERDMLTRDSSVTNAKTNLESQELSLAQRESDKSLRKLALDTAEDTYTKTMSLYEAGISSKSELEGAKSQYDQAVISYDQANLTLASTRISYNAAKTAYNEAIKNYELTVTDYDDRESDLFVIAPISGLVTDVSVQANIMSGNTGVTIVDDSVMVLNVSIMGKFIKTIEEGQSVELTIEYEDRTVEGLVTDISLTASNGYYPVEISIDNADKSLISGMFTEGYIKTRSKTDVTKVEKKTLVQDIDENNYIYVVDESSMTASMVQVDLGIEEGNYVEIIGDVEVGDQVVVIGQDFIEDGQPILIVNDSVGLK